jgi:RimJ/RimL family protein N-acetyltransferase
MTRPSTPRSHGQTFLVGPELYLRPLDLDDATTAPIWQKTPFPVPTELARERLEEQWKDTEDDDPAEMMLIVARRSDDRTIGAVELGYDGWSFGNLRMFLDPLVSQEQRDTWMAELLGMLIPWLLEERNVITAAVPYLADRPIVEQAVASLAGRVSVRQRERWLIDGVRQDRVYYQFFKPAWMDKLGPPSEPVFGDGQRTARAPAPPQVQVPIDTRPEHALAVGERLILRPFEPDEAKLIATWALRETETYYPEGRILFDPLHYGRLHHNIAAKDWPAWIRFAIALRETNELIGANGISSVDWVHRTAETETEIYRPEHRNAGFGTEAKHLLLEYAFDRLGMHMIYSWVAETNPRSAAALRKQGYRDAGTIAWDSFASDGLCGYWGFDLLAEEWRAARKAGVSGTGA